MARNWQLGLSLGKLIHYPDTQATVGQDFAEYCYLCVTIRHWVYYASICIFEG